MADPRPPDDDTPRERKRERLNRPDADDDASAHGWREGHHSTTYRFERVSHGETVAVVEVEEYHGHQHGEADVRHRRRVPGRPYDWETTSSERCGSASEALAVAVERWGVCLPGAALTEVREQVRGAE